VGVVPVEMPTGGALGGGVTSETLTIGVLRPGSVPPGVGGVAESIVTVRPPRRVTTNLLVAAAGDTATAKPATNMAQHISQTISFLDLRRLNSKLLPARWRDLPGIRSIGRASGERRGKLLTGARVCNGEPSPPGAWAPEATQKDARGLARR